MVISRSLEDITAIKSSALTIGSFDGIHIGHIEILKEITSLAKKENTASVVITFDPHPKYVLNKRIINHRRFITTLEKKIKLFDQYGISYVLILPFSIEISNMKAEDFLKNVIIDNFHPHDIVIGYDHHFGHNRRGNLKLLSESSTQFNYRINEISAVKYDGKLVSSTIIRELLLSGEIEKVNQLLGWKYEITGTVVIGDGRGHQIDFPTANIDPYEKKQIIPKNGVYKVRVSINGKEYDGMCNIGKQPTFNGDTERIEVNILTDNTFDLYGKALSIKFYRFLREEKKFNNINELKIQLEKDKIDCLNN